MSDYQKSALKKLKKADNPPSDNLMSKPKTDPGHHSLPPPSPPSPRPLIKIAFELPYLCINK